MATWSKASLIFAAIILLSLSSASVAHGRRSGRRLVRSYDEPCKKMTLYFHDILYDFSNSTATKPTALATAVSPNGTFFGEVVVFDDPMTEGTRALPPSLEETTAARSAGALVLRQQGGVRCVVRLLIVFNFTGRRGTLNLVGADVMSEKTRDLSVVGGTGDFFMSRGVATLRHRRRRGLGILQAADGYQAL